MKRIRLAFYYMMVFALGIANMAAQNAIVKEKTPIEEKEGLLMFKFEPDYVASNEKKSMDIDRARKILDTLQISDRKRHRLLKDLYKNEFSERLQKALVADIKFEEIED